METNVWENMKTLEKDIQDCIKEAYEYQNNTFYSHPEYYISYFEMRKNQCQTLHNLHYEMKNFQQQGKSLKAAHYYFIYLWISKIFCYIKNILLIILIRHRKSTTGKRVRRRKTL